MDTTLPSIMNDVQSDKHCSSRPRSSSPSLHASSGHDATIPASKASFFEIVARKRMSRDWLTYYGRWFVKLHDDAQKSKMIAVRSMRFPDDTRSTVQQLNVYDQRQTPTSKPRDCDEYYHTPFTYDAAVDGAAKDPYNVHTHDRQKPQLMLAFGEAPQEAYATLPMYVAGEIVSTSLVPNMTQDVYRYRFIPSELFISDGPHRWTLCAVYDAEAPGAPIKLANMAIEVATTLDPEEPQLLHKHTQLLPAIRPDLEDDPEQWLPAPARQGVAQTIVVDPATGNLVHLPPAPCTFTPPTPSATPPTHRFLLLPDAAYCLLPVSMEGVRERGEDSFWVEFGVRSAQAGHFRVMRYEYDAAGLFQRLVSEAY